MTRPAPRDAKRAFDLAAAALALAALAPFLLGLALAVRLGMGRPVLFAQRRAGLDGAPFRMVKFRSMTDARDASGRLLPDGQRLMAFGRLLRRTRLDELPELWNILKGEMSFIGPRPLLPETIAGFGAAGRRRGRVRPGLTGWAQVNGNALLRDDDKLALDLWYVERRSFRLDLLIVLKTLRVVLLGERIDDARLRLARAHALDPHRRG